MANQNYIQLEQILAQIGGRVNEICHQATEWKNKAITIKTYEDVVLCKDPRKPFSEAVDEHTQICACLTDLSINLIRVRTLRKSLSSGEVLPAQVNKMQMRIDKMIKDLEDARAGLGYLKESYDARLRFYNSCVYRM